MQEELTSYAEGYQIHLMLGQGGQASVYLGSKNHQLAALKVYQAGANKAAAFLVQVDFLKQLKFPHLINMLDYKEKAKIKFKNKQEEVRPLIVLEFAQGGELFQFISKQGRFSPQVCRVYIKQLISAIKYMADIGVAHRDLKPQNILFDKEFNLKVSDFGLSRQAKGNVGDFKLRSRVGTQGYKPPEMEIGCYQGIHADIFAAGVCLFIMYSGSPPFLSTKPHERIYKLIKEKNFIKFWQLHEKSKPPQFFSPEFKRLMNSFFSYEIDRRPTFQSLLADDWMNGDEILKHDLISYMKSKSEKISESDEIKNKITEIKKKMFQEKLKDVECQYESGDGYRGESDEQQNQDIEESQAFIKSFKKLHIDLQDLPVYKKQKIVYIKQKPAFIVAWLKNYLSQQFKNKQVFINYIEEVVPLKYQLNHINNSNNIKLSLIFQIDENEVELKICGQLHRTEQDQVGIEWIKQQGHDYWLTLLQNRLNQTLKEMV